MKTTEEIIDEIIQKSPHGGKLWKHRLKQKRAAQNKSSQNEDSKTEVEPIQDHPKQTYFNFEEE
jgi:hypothetical protein